MTIPTTLKHGSAPWWVLQTLRDFGPMTDKELKAMGTHEAPAAIKAVQQLHMIAKNYDGIYELQPKGRNALNASNRQRWKDHRTTLAGSRVTTNAGMRAIYNGAELRPFIGRPGAMDAFEMPSRRSDGRYFRDGRVEAAQ